MTHAEDNKKHLESMLFMLFTTVIEARKPTKLEMTRPFLLLNLTRSNYRDLICIGT